MTTYKEERERHDYSEACNALRNKALAFADWCNEASDGNDHDEACAYAFVLEELAKTLYQRADALRKRKKT